jgi:flagellar biosynthesis/type III secretory pathway chaperone
MDISGSQIECLFQEKLLLYRDLLEVLKQERKRILDTDVDSLWEISRKKQEIAGKIEGLRREVFFLSSAKDIVPCTGGDRSRTEKSESEFDGD